MTEPEETLRDSPVDFDSAVAYALHPEMRRLILLYIAGVLILPFGLEMFLNTSPFVGGAVTILLWILGLVVAIVGATLLFAGLVGAAFKLVTDANFLATEE